MVRFKKLKKEPGVNVTFDLEEPSTPWNEAPEGLVPINDSGFYATPDEPADPRDCDRYPDSIYCGNPFTPTFAEFEPSFILDECNVGVQFDGAFGFIKVPPVAIVWRKPECRNPPPTPPVEIPPGESSAIPFPYNNCEESSLSFAVVWRESFQQIEDWAEDFYIDGRWQRKPVKADGTYGVQVLNVVFPWNGEFGREVYADGSVGNRYRAKITLRYYAYSSYNEWWHRLYRSPNDPYESSSEVIVERYVDRREDSTLEFFGFELNTPVNFMQTSTFVMRMRWESRGIRNYTSTYPARANNNDITGTFTDIATYGIQIYCGKISSNSPNYPPPPKRLNPPPRYCCMSCCPSNNNNDDLVRALIAKIDKLSQIVGVDEFPANVPESFISKDEGFIGNLIPNASKSIPNLTQFLVWYIERFDEIMGQWEIPIEIKDSDPSKPGDQPLGVRLPNIAEAIGEIFTLAFQSNLNTETLLNFAVRNAGESAADKQQNFITYKLLQSLTEWAGYKQKDIKLKMPLLYTLNKVRYDEILKESEVEVPCAEFDEKFGLEADLMRIREAIAMLEANYKRKLDPNGDIKAQIAKHLLDAFTAIKKVEDDEDDMDEFINQVEQGFGNVAGVTDPTRPYGRDYSQRPRIRDLTNGDPSIGE